MSYTEFTYQLLQGYDFLNLFDDEGVNVQIGGSDQWGNITAGTDLIRRILHTEGAYGLTFPLLLKSDGKIRCRCCQILTFLAMEEISKIESEMQGPGYVPNSAPRFVHGEEGLSEALKATQALRPGLEDLLGSTTNVNERKIGAANK